MKKWFSFIVDTDRLYAIDGVTSHEDLVDEFGLEDGVDVKIVRCRLCPLAEFSLDYDKWEFLAEQDIIPDWFVEEEWKQKSIKYLQDNPSHMEVQLADKRIK